MFRSHPEHFYQLIEAFAENEETKDRIAIYNNDESKVTYSELNQQVNRLAHYLLDVKNGVNTPETRIGLFFYLSIEYFICMFAIMKAGLSFVPFSPNTEVERLREFVKQSQIKLLFSYSPLRDNLFLTANEYPITFFDRLHTQLNHYPISNPLQSVSLDQLAYVHNTSGSTAKPKQVLINHSGLLNCATDLVTRLDITSQDKTAAYADISFDAHIAEMMMTLGAGASLYLVPPATRLNYLSLTQYYNSHGITVSTLTPSVLNALSPKSFPALRVLLSTGEAVTGNVVEKWCQSNGNLLFVNGYGPAEVTIATSIAILKPGDPIHIGEAIKGLTMYVLEKEPKNRSAPQWVEPGERGELYIGGAGVGRGYSDLALTAERFVTVADPDDASRHIRLYQTRDEARYELTLDKYYQFFVSGRLDRQVKIYGKLICPEEIEALLLTEEVIQAQIDPQKTVSGHPAFIAYLYVRDGFDLYEYYASIVKKLPAAVSPSRWVVSNKTLLSTSSKNALKSLDLKPVYLHAHSTSKPTHAIEIELANIWKQVLEITDDIEFTLDDQFFMLGGTSLQVANLLVILRERFQLKLTLEEFRYIPTIGALARSIIRLKNKNTINTPILLNEKNAVLRNETPLFLIHSLMGDAERDYEKLVSRWPSRRSIYGISSRSFKNIEDSDSNLDAIANDYITAMKSVQPRGPYLLGGWSAGGLIAYAMCQILKKQNEKVYLHMIDSEALNLYRQKNNVEYASYLLLLFELKLSSMLNIPTSPIAQDTLESLPKTKQIYLFFAALLTTVQSSKESNQALLQQRMGLIITVKNTLLAILNYVETAKVDNAILWAATETQKKCKNKRLLWQENECEFNSIQILDGNHESILLDPMSAKTLSEKLEKQCNLQMEAENKFIVHYFNRPNNLNHCISREKELDNLQKIFRKIGRNQSLAVINHDDSVGKSQIAADYFHQTTQEYELKLWFRADSKEALLEDYENFAKEFKFFIAPNNLVESVKSFLDKHENWLAVYDNAGSFNELKDLLPLNRGHVIITTQHSAWSDIGFDIGMSRLSEENALSLLQAGFNLQEDVNTLNTLINKLNKLPTAIKQLGSYLKHTEKTSQEFLSDFVKCDLLEKDVYHFLIHEIIISLKNDIQNNFDLKFSLDILQALVHLHTAGGSSQLLITFLRKLDKTASMETLESLLDKTIEHLSAYSLITYDPILQIVYMNRLTQKCLKPYLHFDNAKQSIFALIKALQISAPTAKTALSNFCVLASSIEDYAPLTCANIYVQLSELYCNSLASSVAINTAQKALDISLNLEDKSQTDFYKVNHQYIKILTSNKSTDFEKTRSDITQIDLALKNFISSIDEHAQSIPFKRINLRLNLLIPALIKRQEYVECSFIIEEAATLLESCRSFANNSSDQIILSEIELKIKFSQYEINNLRNTSVKSHELQKAPEIPAFLPNKKKYLSYINQKISAFKADPIEKWELLVEACNLSFSTNDLSHIISLLNDMAACQLLMNDKKTAFCLYSLAIIIYKKYLTNTFYHFDIAYTYLGLGNLNTDLMQNFYYQTAIWNYSLSSCDPKIFPKIQLKNNDKLSASSIEKLTAKHKKSILDQIPSLDECLAIKGINLNTFSDELSEIGTELSKIKWEEQKPSPQRPRAGFFEKKKIKPKKLNNIKPNLPWLQNSQFTGRTQFLQAIDNSLPPTPADKSSAVFTIHGMSGVGKSQSAVQYAYLSLQNKKYEFVWFISAANLTDGFLELSDAFNIPTHFAPAKRISAAKEYLETNYSEKWLIIIDDAKDYESVKTAFVGTTGGHFLMTSKNPNTWSFAKELLIFDRTESLNLVTKILPTDVKKNPADADDLSVLLGDLPLALMQACAYIHASCTIKEYINLYKTQRKELWSSEDPPNDYPTTVSATFELNLKAVNELVNTPVLNEFLSCCAYLHQDAIPKWLLKSLIPNALLLSNMIKSLLKYSLIQASDEKIAIHPMVQQVMRDKLPNASVKVITLLTQQSMTTDHTHALAHNRELLEHYDAALEFHSGDVEGVHLFFIAGLTHLRLGNPYKAKEFFETSLKIKAAKGSNNDLEHARILDYLGTAYGKLDFAKRKEEILLQSLEIKLNHSKQNKDFTENHPEFARTYNNLGNSYVALGDVTKQIFYLEKSYNILVKNYGESNSESALIQANLGMAYGLDGQKTKGKRYLQEALLILEPIYGKKHYYIGQTLNNLAGVFGPLEWDTNLMNDLMVDINLVNDHIECSIIPCIEKQLPLMEEAVAIYKDNYTESNINTAYVQRNLATLYNVLNRKSEQIQLLKAIVPVYISFFGSTHKNTLEIITQLAVVENNSSANTAVY